MVQPHVYINHLTTDENVLLAYLIPDDRYRTLFEGANFTEVVDKGIGDNMPEGVTIEDLQKIQRCHDFQACDIQKGRSTAWDHNLFVSAITTILGE